MATLYKRGDGQWEAAVRRKGFPTQRMTWGNKARAEQWALGIESAMNAGTFQDTRRARRLLLRDVIKDYKLKVASKLKNASEQCRIADALAVEFGTFGLLNLSSEQIAVYRDRLLREGKAASTVNHHINTLSAVYTAAVKVFYYKVPLNPVRAVMRVTPPAPRRQRVPSWAVDALIAANQTSNETRKKMGGPECTGQFGSFLRLALTSCMRRGEIDQLSWPHIDLQSRTATLPDTKNGTVRVVPLSLEAIAIFKAIKQVEGRDRVFTLTAAGFKSAYRRARADVARDRPEILKIRFHDTRREATSQMAKKLPNVVELAAVTGHKKLDMLKVYYQPDPTELAHKLDQEPLKFGPS